MGFRPFEHVQRFEIEKCVMAIAGPAACVDEVGIAELFHPVHPVMAMHDGADVFHRHIIVALYPVDGPEADMFGAGAERLVHLLPVIKRAVGMDQPDRTCLCFNLHSERQRAQGLTYFRLLAVFKVEQPVPAMKQMIDMGVGITERMSPSQKVMIALNGENPGLGQPVEHRTGLRAAVDKITHRKKPVFARVKADTGKPVFQRSKTAMNIAHRKVAARLVLFDDLELRRGHWGGSSGRQRVVAALGRVTA